MKVRLLLSKLDPGGITHDVLHHYIHHSMCCVLPDLHRHEQPCERVWHSVGTAKLAFLIASPCQLLFRSSTQETCAPAEKAWQTQHNSLRVGGALKQERMRERLGERLEDLRWGGGVHAGWDKTGERDVANQPKWETGWSGGSSCFRYRTRKEMVLVFFFFKGGGGVHSWQGKRERKLRGPGMKRKGWPRMWTKEERATEKRGERREQTGERGLDRGGVKSGDLQVQLEQPMTLMVH